VLRLLDAVIFNALIGNHDAHAKNISLRYAGETSNKIKTKVSRFTLAEIVCVLWAGPIVNLEEGNRP
jgi:hypothetical protein